MGQFLDDINLRDRSWASFAMAILRCLSKIGEGEPCVQAGLTKFLYRADADDLLKAKARQVLNRLKPAAAQLDSSAATSVSVDTTSAMPQPHIAAEAETTIDLAEAIEQSEHVAAQQEQAQLQEALLKSKADA